MRRYLVLQSLVLAMCLSGCMTVTRGASDDIRVISKPTGAQVSAELLKLGEHGELVSAVQDKDYICNSTPCGISIPRSKHARFTVEKDGFQPIKFLVISKGSAPNSTIRGGTIVAGTLSGSYVVAGKPKDMTRFLSGNSMVALQTLTIYGAVGSVVDKVSGANRSFAPNPVTVFLAPIESDETETDKEETRDENK